MVITQSCIRLFPNKNTINRNCTTGPNLLVFRLLRSPGQPVGLARLIFRVPICTVEFTTIQIIYIVRNFREGFRNCVELRLALSWTTYIPTPTQLHSVGETIRIQKDVSVLTVTGWQQSLELPREPHDDDATLMEQESPSWDSVVRPCLFYFICSVALSMCYYYIVIITTGSNTSWDGRISRRWYRIPNTDTGNRKPWCVVA